MANNLLEETGRYEFSVRTVYTTYVSSVPIMQSPIGGPQHALWI